MVHINSLYLDNERSIEKNNMACKDVCILSVICICTSEYHTFIYILETVSFLKLLQHENRLILPVFEHKQGPYVNRDTLRM
jgi:hypothetical protein